MSMGSLLMGYPYHSSQARDMVEQSNRYYNMEEGFPRKECVREYIVFLPDLLPWCNVDLASPSVNKLLGGRNALPPNLPSPII